MKHTDFMKIAGANWSKVTPSEMKKYEKLAEEDKKRYEAQMKEWTKHGYYTLPDGSKSSKWARKAKKPDSESSDSESEETPVFKPKKKSRKSTKLDSKKNKS